MKVLIKLSNDWPEHVSGNQSLISGFTRFLGPASNAFYYVKMVMFISHI
jgi:hypothetical protein